MSEKIDQLRITYLQWKLSNIKKEDICMHNTCGAKRTYCCICKHKDYCREHAIEVGYFKSHHEHLICHLCRDDIREMIK